MTTYLRRPFQNVTPPAISSVSPTGATALGNISDNFDGTWVERLGPTMEWVIGYAAPSVPTTEFVARVSGSVRYRGGNSSVFVSNYPYRASVDSLPTIVPAIFMGGASFTTVEIGRRVADWTRASITGLRSRFTDTLAAPGVDYAEAWMTIYTITVSTATASNVTMVVSNTPTIPVAVVNTIDWESSLSTSSPLRKVTVEVRIEANTSTGAGTSPALLTTTVDIVPNATGTENLSIVMPGTLANGTYKVYTRARRYSEATTPANESEMFSAWSAAATLTMNVTAMGTPTITATADNTLDRASLNVTVPTTSPYTSATVTVQRSIDAGTTWETVRGIDGVAIALATPTTFYDYEAPAGVPVLYRAQAVGLYLTDSVTSPWSGSSTMTLAALTEWNLKVPETPELNIIGVNVVGSPEETLGEEVGVFRPIDRRYPVVVSGELTGWDGSISISTVTAAAWTALAAVLENQKVLLLQSPFGWQKYIRIVGDVKTAIQGTPTAPRRRATLTYVETAAP